MFDGAVQLRYHSLDPRLDWEMSVVYMAYMAEANFGGGQPDICHRRLRCTADGHEVHSYLEKPFPMRQLTFAVPRAATADGELTLSFTQDYPDNLGECTVRTISPRWCSTGDGRGNSVAEVWLRPTNLTHADKIPSSRALSTTHAEVFDVTKHGAKGDGRSRDDDAIQATFAACATSSAIGPREVLFPAPGTYVTGPWELACNNSVVTVQQGASVVSFTANGSTRGWPLGPLTSPEPSQGLTDKQATPFILAHYVHNVTLRGGGTLDAGGKPFWQERCGNWWCPKWAPGVSPKKPYAWRPFMLRIDHSADVTVDGLRFEATAFWCIVPVRSQRIEISNVTIYARDGDGATPNTDGIEPMWTKDVHIHDVKIDNGDDCVTIKSGSSDIVVERLDCTHSHGITIGSIWYDDVTNVTYRQVHLHDCRCGPRIKGREQGNATISDIHFEDIVMDNTATAGICVDMTYETPGSTHKNLGCTAQGVAYTNVTGSVGQSIGSLECLPTRPCSVTMNDIEITSKFKHATWKCKSVHAVPEGSIEPPLPSACNITDNDGR